MSQTTEQQLVDLQRRMSLAEQRLGTTVPIGPVLTYVQNMDQLHAQMRRQYHSVIKVVTSWGVDGGWTQDRIREVCQYPMVIVRTYAGDPSSPGAPGLPEYKHIVRELAPWIVENHQNMWIEIGNEPNVRGDEAYYWDYRWHLVETITNLRNRYPNLKFIAPSPVMDASRRASARRWEEICRDALQMYDAQALHAYEFTRFSGSDSGRTLQLEEAIRMFPYAKNYVLTEFGINSPGISQLEKLRMYRELSWRLPPSFIAATYYHLTVKPSDEDQKRYQVWI